MRTDRDNQPFIVEAFDDERWCAVLAAKIEHATISGLRAILGSDAADDPNLERQYTLEPDQLNAIEAQFDVRLDLAALGLQRVDVTIFRARWTALGPPYLMHTGYELPLMLEGRKKLAFFSWQYPPQTFPGEESFDRWVQKGVLHKEVVLEPFDHPKFDGLRTVYYTVKGEEWRIPAFKLLHSASGRSGGWNEHFERLEGMLLGYEDWQNDWWIDAYSGAWAGLALCCAVSTEGLRWIEGAGFRALPPCRASELRLAAVDHYSKDELRRLLLEGPDDVAVVRFNVPGRAIMDFVDLRESGPWLLPSDRIPDVNRNLRRPVKVILNRTA